MIDNLREIFRILTNVEKDCEVVSNKLSEAIRYCEKNNNKMTDEEREMINKIDETVNRIERLIF